MQGYCTLEMSPKASPSKVLERRVEKSTVEVEHLMFPLGKLDLPEILLKISDKNQTYPFFHISAHHKAFLGCFITFDGVNHHSAFITKAVISACYKIRRVHLPFLAAQSLTAFRVYCSE